MAEIKVENKRRQKVLTVYRIELLPHFFLGCRIKSKVDGAYCGYKYTCGYVQLQVLLVRWLRFHILCCNDT